MENQSGDTTIVILLKSRKGDLNIWKCMLGKGLWLGLGLPSFTAVKGGKSCLPSFQTHPELEIVVRIRQKALALLFSSSHELQDTV